jgi:hypothetical protein
MYMNSCAGPVKWLGDTFGAGQPGAQQLSAAARPQVLPLPVAANTNLIPRYCKYSTYIKYREDLSG